MTGRTKAFGIVIVAIISSLTLPAYSQGAMGKKGGKGGGPPTENHPKIDEKAYKAALDRIPTPKEPYDPWGKMRPPEPGKTGDKAGK